MGWKGHGGEKSGVIEGKDRTGNIEMKGKEEWKTQREFIMRKTHDKEVAERRDIEM